MEMNRCVSAETDFGINIFFPLTMDHVFASVEIHWLSHSAENRSVFFHMRVLSNHVLTELDGLRALHRIVKNILDYSERERLPRI